MTWSSTGASACTASGDWSGAEPTSGSLQVTPISAGSNVFTLSCTGAGGSGSGSATLTVAPSDPVAGSEGDSTILGTDSDHNGVRDDVDAFIKSRYASASDQQVMTNYAVAETAFVVANGDATAAPAAVPALGQSIVCAENHFGMSQAQVEETEIQSAILNNQGRFAAYVNSSSVISSGITAATTCNLDGASPHALR